MSIIKQIEVDGKIYDLRENNPKKVVVHKAVPLHPQVGVTYAFTGTPRFKFPFDHEIPAGFVIIHDNSEQARILIGYSAATECLNNNFFSLLTISSDFLNEDGTVNFDAVGEYTKRYEGEEKRFIYLKTTSPYFEVRAGKIVCIKTIQDCYDITKHNGADHPGYHLSAKGRLFARRKKRCNFDKSKPDKHITHTFRKLVLSNNLKGTNRVYPFAKIRGKSKIVVNKSEFVTIGGISRNVII